MKKKKKFCTFIQINGEKFSFLSCKILKLEDLICIFNYDKKSIILEHRGKICNTNKTYNLKIKSQDWLDFITIVGGG